MDLLNRATGIEEQVRIHSRNATIGSVVKVFEHTDPEDNSNHEVNVLLRDGGKEPRRIPVMSNHHGEAIVPQKGDFVLIEFLDGASDAPVVTDVVQNDKRRAPLARAGHWRHEFGPERTESLYIEAEPADHGQGEPNVIRIAKKPDGLSDPTVAVELDDSGDSPVVRIQGDADLDIAVDGDVSISAGGDVVIDQGGSSKKVATEDHTHTVSQSDGGTTTTSKPDDVTSTEIE